jgi:hypothetical protein
MLATLLLYVTSFGLPGSPGATLSNGQIEVKLYLPDQQRGFYRGTRFDWSGVIHSLKFQGHDYYGPWFTKTNPTVSDFIYDGSDITAGPCSAAVGPVDEFGPVGWEDAKPGGTFIKIGVGALRKPADGAAYDNYRLYDIAGHGKWKIQKTNDSIEFSQKIKDPASGYGYSYSKTVQLTEGKPEMILVHTLKNTGSRTIKTTVYNHNFLALDHQPPGPGISITLPFQIQSPEPPKKNLAEVQGNKVVYLETLKDKDTVEMAVEGFGSAAEDNQIRIENQALGAGLTIQGDHPLVSEFLWSIRSVLAVEPFIAISLEPGQEMSWKTTYNYFTLPARLSTRGHR